MRVTKIKRGSSMRQDRPRQWEYRTEMTLNWGTLEPYLNDLGREGWEVISVQNTGRDWEIVAKREVVAAPSSISVDKMVAAMVGSE